MSWIKIDADSPFSLANVPFGICSPTAGASPRAATRLGDHVVDIAALAKAGLLDNALEQGERHVLEQVRAHIHCPPVPSSS